MASLLKTSAPIQSATVARSPFDAQPAGVHVEVDRLRVNLDRHVCCSAVLHKPRAVSAVTDRGIEHLVSTNRLPEFPRGAQLLLNAVVMPLAQRPEFPYPLTSPAS